MRRLHLQESSDLKLIFPLQVANKITRHVV